MPSRQTLDSMRHNLVNGFAEFRPHGEDATRFSLVGLFPLVIVDARSLTRSCLTEPPVCAPPRNHSPRAEEDTVERHRLHTVLKRPQASNVGPNTLAITKARAGDEGDVRMGSNGAICGKSRLVEVFVRMVAASP